MGDAVDYPFGNRFGNVIMPISYGIDEDTGYIQNILLGPIVFKKNVSILISISSEMSHQLKTLYARIIKFPYREQWKIVGMGVSGSPDYEPTIMNGMAYVELSKMSDMAIIFMHNYVDWLVHSNSIRQTYYMPLHMRREIISQVIPKFFEHRLSLSLIVAEFEDREGLVDIDENLNNLTLRHLEKFYDFYINSGLKN